MPLQPLVSHFQERLSITYILKRHVALDAVVVPGVSVLQVIALAIRADGIPGVATRRAVERNP